MNVSGRVAISILKMAGVVALCGWILGAYDVSTFAKLPFMNQS